MSTLGYAILGMLASRPQTGYEVAQHLRAPIGFMWAAQHSQVYPELARLAAAGLVSATVIAGRGPRDTKRYTVTDAGRDQLAAWADSPLPPEVPRSELLLRVRSLWLTSPDRAAAFLRTERERTVERLGVLARERLEFAPDDVVAWDHSEFFAYATLQHGISRTRAALAWFDWLLDQVERQRRGELGTMLTSAGPAAAGRDEDL